MLNDSVSKNRDNERHTVTHTADLQYKNIWPQMSAVPKLGEPALRKRNAPETTNPNFKAIHRPNVLSL